MATGAPRCSRSPSARVFRQQPCFKRFPTKASLFEALVLDFWNIDPGLPAVVQARDPSAGLHEIGAELAALCRRPDMVAFYRMFIAESQQFPEMGALMLDRGKSPTIGRISAYLNTQVTKGGLKSADTVGAAHQFMGMITDQLFWPVLLSPGYEVSDQAAEEIVAEAVLTLMARYGV